MIMNIEIDIREDILKDVERLLHYNNLLIEQCNSWLFVEEGNRNMELRIAERRKNRRGEPVCSPNQESEII